MTPFTIAIPQTELDDLRRRLAATRFPAALEGVAWSYGIDQDFIRDFIDYWANRYDWRAAEARLNGLNQFVEEIDGEAVHFVHMRGQGETNVPLLLTNGWPSNFVELLPLVPLLTEPQDGIAFDIVIPSLPGYGFSGQPKGPGMNMSRIARLWDELMTRLNYPRFLVSGSDMGAGAEMMLVKTRPERLIGAHYVNVYSGFPAPDQPTPEEAEYLKANGEWSMQEGAYAMIQGTKPATLAVGLNDSPAGLAAWILEKFHGWSDNGGDLANAFDRDDLCTLLSVYWFTGTIGSSIRLYREAFMDEGFMSPTPRHDVPHAILLPPADHPAPRAWAERNLQNIVRWTELDAGGHFPALETPEALAHDIRAFYRQIA